MPEVCQEISAVPSLPCSMTKCEGFAFIHPVAAMHVPLPSINIAKARNTNVSHCLDPMSCIPLDSRSEIATVFEVCHAFVGGARGRFGRAPLADLAALLKHQNARSVEIGDGVERGGIHASSLAV